MKIVIEVDINEDENTVSDVCNALKGMAVKACSKVPGDIVSAVPYSHDAQATVREIIGELEESGDPHAALRIANEYLERQP